MKIEMVDWNVIRALDAIARTGTLSAAATELGVSVPTLGRLISAAEAAIDLSLVTRRPKGSSLTTEGHAVLTASAPAVEALKELPRVLRALKAGSDVTPIRISSTEPILCEFLAPNLSALFQQMPDAVIELESSNAVSHLNRGEADIAVRMIRPEEDTLIARALPPITMGLYASEAYLSTGGAVDGELTDSRILAYDPAFGAIAENLWLDRAGLGSRAQFRSGSVRALLVAARSGAGVALLPDFLGQGEGLRRLAKDPAIQRTPWLVYHRDHRRVLRHKVIRNWIVDSFKERFAVG